MAAVTSGSFDTPLVYYTNSANKKGLRFSWSLVSQDPQRNTSTIKYSVTGIGQNAYNGVWVWMYDCTVIIRSQTVYSTSSFGELRLNQVVASGTITLNNNSDGTLSFSASVSCHIGYPNQSSNGSKSWTLPQIPRHLKVNIKDAWKNGIVWVKTPSAWKKGILWLKVNDAWQKMQ